MGNSIERLTAEVQMLRQYNKKLVGRLDDQSISYEEALRKGSERKNIIKKKDEVIVLLQQELDAYACSSNKGSDLESFKSMKLAVVADNEVQFKSLADAYEAKNSIKDFCSTYSNVIGSCKNDRTGDIEHKTSCNMGIMELQNALKMKIKELELVKKQDSNNANVIHKLRQLLWGRDVQYAEIKRENSNLSARIKTMQNEHSKNLSEANARKNEEYQKYHKLLSSINEYDKSVKQYFINYSTSARSSARSDENTNEPCDPQEILKKNLNLLKKVMKENKEKALMKRITEQAHEKHELQEEIKRLKETLKTEQEQQQPKNHNDSLEWTDRQATVLTKVSSPNEISTLPGKISGSSSDSAYGKSISGDHDRKSEIVKDSQEIYDDYSLIKECILQYHEKVRKEALECNIFEYLLPIQTSQSNRGLTSIMNSDHTLNEKHQNIHIDIVMKAFKEISEVLNSLLLSAKRDIKAQSIIEMSCRSLLHNVERLKTIANSSYTSNHYSHLPKTTKGDKHISDGDIFLDLEPGKIDELPLVHNNNIDHYIKTRCEPLSVSSSSSGQDVEIDNHSEHKNVCKIYNDSLDSSNHGVATTLLKNLCKENTKIQKNDTHNTNRNRKSSFANVRTVSDHMAVELSSNESMNYVFTFKSIESELPHCFTNKQPKNSLQNETKVNSDNNEEYNAECHQIRCVDESEETEGSFQQPTVLGVKPVESTLSTYHSKASFLWGFSNSCCLETENLQSCIYKIPKKLYFRTRFNIWFHPYLSFILYALSKLTDRADNYYYM